MKVNVTSITVLNIAIHNRYLTTPREGVMKYDGEYIIGRIIERLKDEDTRCYDSAIVNKIRSLTHSEMTSLCMMGDVAKWRNERINAKNLTE